MKFLLFVGVIAFIFSFYDLLKKLQQNKEKEKRIEELKKRREKFYLMYLERRKTK
jgi:hypothetical protein